jgi:hypothetical protein
MANDNVEGSAATSMANSDKYGGFTKMRNLYTKVMMPKDRSNSSGGSMSSSSSSSSGGGGDEWNAERYKNHNEYKQNEHVRNAETNANNAVLKNASRDAKFIRKNTMEGNRQARDKDTLEHAAKYGQVRNVDLSTPKKRTTISFDASPVRETNPGKGAGAQGTSRQQSKPGGRAPRTNVRTIFDPSTKAVTGYSYGGRHDAWDDKLDSRPAVKAGGKKIAPGTTAGEAAAADKPTSGVGGSIGGKLGAVAGAAISKSPTGTALGAKAGEALGNAIEKKVVNRKPRAKKA